MSNNNSKIKQLAEKYNLEKDDFWQLPNNRGVWIIKHDAVERIAKQEGVIFENPTIVEHSREHCVLLGTAVMFTEYNDPDSKIEEWTFGEADKKTNCHNNYIFAMAEKRLKDRLTLKIVGAYEYGIYSDTEADAFRQSPAEAKMNQPNCTVYQLKEIEKLLNESAFKHGTGIKILDEVQGKIDKEKPLTKVTANEILTTLYNHTAEFNALQKQNKVA